AHAQPRDRRAPGGGSRAPRHRPGSRGYWLDASQPRRGRRDRRLPLTRAGRPPDRRREPRALRRRHHHDRRRPLTMQTIGFIGLGKIGGNMAARYLAAGYAMYAEPRNRNGAQWLIEQG